jgi:hypothetical protein
MRPYAAAKAYELPANWRDGRDPQVVEAWAVDPSDTLDADDIMRQDGADGEGILYVGIADVSFLRTHPVLAPTAEKRKATKYDASGRAVTPMLPRPISEDKLSLLDGQERPALGLRIPVAGRGVDGPLQISYDIARARQITYDEADRLIAGGGDDPDAVSLRGLALVAHNLRQARLPGTAGNFVVQNEDGQAIGRRGGINASRIMVSEIMITANTQLGKFVRENNIPRLNRNCTLGGLRLADLGGLIDVLPAELLHAFWSTESLGHIALNVEDYAQGTSPLRRLADFILHANLAAFHAGEPFPYPEERASPIGVRLNRRRPPRPNQTEPSQRAIRIEEIRTTGILEKIEGGAEMDPTELMAVIFNPTENEDATANARAAVRYLTEHATISNSVFDHAIGAGFLRVRPATPEDGVGDAPMVAEVNGRPFPYTPSDNKMLRFHARTQLFGAVAGMSPEESRPVAAYLQRPVQYLLALRKHGNAVYRNRYITLGQGWASCEAYVYVRGELHSVAAVGKNIMVAEGAAAAELVERLNLFLDPPTEKMSDEEMAEWKARLLSIGEEETPPQNTP